MRPPPDRPPKIGMPVDDDEPSLVTEEATAPQPLPADAEPETLDRPLARPSPPSTRGAPAARAITKLQTNAEGIPILIPRDEAGDDTTTGSLRTPRLHLRDVLRRDLPFAKTIAADRESAEEEERRRREREEYELNSSDGSESETVVGTLPLPGDLTEEIARKQRGEEPTLDPREAALALGADPDPSDAEPGDDTKPRHAMPEPGDDTRPRQPMPEPGDETKPRHDVVLPDLRDSVPPVPPARPRLDSEAAGEWAPWHAPSEKVKAAVATVGSPVASGTEALPWAVVKAALDQVGQTSARPPKGEPAGNTLARPATAPLGVVPGGGANPGPLETAPHFPPPNASTPATPAAPPTTAGPSPLIPPPPPAPMSDRSSALPRPAALPQRPAKAPPSPVTVFIVSFLLVSTLLGGAVALKLGWRPLSQRATATAVDPGRTAEPAGATSASFGASSASETTGAPSASSSAPRNRPRDRDRRPPPPRRH